MTIAATGFDDRTALQGRTNVVSRPYFRVTSLLNSLNLLPPKAARNRSGTIGRCLTRVRNLVRHPKPKPNGNRRRPVYFAFKDFTIRLTTVVGYRTMRVLLAKVQIKPAHLFGIILVPLFLCPVNDQPGWQGPTSETSHHATYIRVKVEMRMPYSA